MTEILLIVILYFIISIAFIVNYFYKYKVTPVLIFLLMQQVMFIGLITAPHINTTNGVVLISIYLSALFFFILGVRLKIATYHQKSSNYYTSLSPNQTVRNGISLMISSRQYRKIFFLILISFIACVWFYSMAGVNLFLESLTDFFRNDYNVYRDERFAFFNIPGTGYIYQLRTVVLPIFNLFLIFYEPIKKYRKIAYILLPFTVLFLLGTGQRNAFVFVIVFAIMYSLNLSKALGKPINKKKLLLLVIGGSFFLALLTIANGRVSDETSLLEGAFYSIFERVFSINSVSALNAFKYIQTQPTVWGYDWLMMVADILPGKTEYLSVDRIVYYIAYGNYSGTGPPCIWGSAWYNWSYIGVSVYPLLLGFLYQSVYYFFKSRNNRLDILFYSFFCVYLGVWTMSSPAFLFNNGIVAMFLVMWFLYTKIRC